MGEYQGSTTYNHQSIEYITTHHITNSHFSTLPFNAESTLITNLGPKGCQKATMVSPYYQIRNTETFGNRCRTIRQARFAPAKMRARPPIKRSVFNITKSTFTVFIPANVLFPLKITIPIWCVLQYRLLFLFLSIMTAYQFFFLSAVKMKSPVRDYRTECLPLVFTLRLNEPTEFTHIVDITARLTKVRKL